MSSIKKLFFLGALFAVVALAPNAVFAAQSAVKRLDMTPKTINALSTKDGVVQFTVTAYDALSGGNPVVISTVNDITVEIIPESVTESKNILLNSSLAPFTVEYGYKAVRVDNEIVTIKVKVKTAEPSTFVETTAAVTFKEGWPAGSTCNPNATPSECFTGNTCDSARGLCIPNVDKRKIGTFCAEANDCSLSTGTLTLTCDTGDNNACVGATNNVSCSDNDVNNDAHYGKIATQLSSDQRCGSGLVCDAKELKCVNDFGQGKVPANSLGETATDIRDQIRNIINIALGFLGVAGVIVTLYGGFTWMTAFGDDEKVGKAKKTIVAGIIGIIIIGVAWTIVSYVLNVTSTIS